MRICSDMPYLVLPIIGNHKMLTRRTVFDRVITHEIAQKRVK